MVADEIQYGHDVADLLGTKGCGAGQVCLDPETLRLRVKLNIESDDQPVEYAEFPLRVRRSKFDRDVRDFLAGASIQSVVVTRKRIASDYHYHVVFTARREKQPEEAAASKNGTVVAINLGWRRLTDGEGIRVATIRSSEPIEGLPSYLICPEATIRDLDRAEAIQSQRDDEKNRILEWLTAIDWSSAPPELAELGATLRIKPASATYRIVRLSVAWRHHDWQPEWRDRLDAWRRYEDKPDWAVEASPGHRPAR